VSSPHRNPSWNGGSCHEQKNSNRDGISTLALVTLAGPPAARAAGMVSGYNDERIALQQLTVGKEGQYANTRSGFASTIYWVELG
jgi:hypothetical protein